MWQKPKPKHEINCIYVLSVEKVQKINDFSSHVGFFGIWLTKIGNTLIMITYQNTVLTWCPSALSVHPYPQHAKTQSVYSQLKKQTLFSLEKTAPFTSNIHQLQSLSKKFPSMHSFDFRACLRALPRCVCVFVLYVLSVV